jgi:polysaccharide deacetylase family protein (PEP-CTERM system associated)
MIYQTITGVVPFIVNNSLTIDVEDWFHVCGLKEEPRISRSDWRVRRTTELLLRLLAECGVKATFFMLGCVAEAEPSLAPLIVAQGHEIASHGYSHRLLTALTPDEFRDELKRTNEIISQQTGCRPIGFRAPQWSVSDKTPWVHDILCEFGYLYDSSCNPLPFVGNPAYPCYPYPVRTSHGTVWEIPPMVTSSPFGNLPTGGGWGFRLFPFRTLADTVMSYNRAGHGAVIYLHPREVDPDGPRLRLSPLKGFAAYGTRRDAAPRLRALLGRFSFTTMKDMVGSWRSVS